MVLRAVYRGYGRSMLLLPGLGFGNEIFHTLDLPFDYLFAREPITSVALHEILAEMEGVAGKGVVLFGWSLGALMAVDLAAMAQEMVDALVLVSIRRRYPTDRLHHLADAISSDKERAMDDFYRGCFFGQKGDYLPFKEHLQPLFLERWNVEALLSGLDGLRTEFPDLGELNCKNIHLLHGSKDIIAPLDDLPPRPPEVAFHLVRSGHLPFLHPAGQKFLREAF